VPKAPKPLVLRKRSSGRLRAVLLVLLLAVVAAGGWALFSYGRTRAGFDAAAAARTRAEMMERILQLKTANDRLTERLALAQRSRQIDREAYARVRRLLKRLQDESLELKQELAFYRTVVGPHPGGAGLQVQSLRLRPAGPARTYRYELILSRVRSRGQEARGTVRLVVEGTQGGVSRRVDLSESAGGGALKYRFKYFQRLQGRIRLPAGFRPDAVRVRLQPAGRRSRPVERTFQWPQAAGENAHVG